MVDIDITLEYGMETVVSFHGVFHGCKVASVIYQWELIFITMSQLLFLWCNFVCRQYVKDIIKYENKDAVNWEHMSSKSDKRLKK